MEVRLQKFMARAGIGSRRACEEIIRQGRVTVDGKTATLGTKVDPNREYILVDGEPLTGKESLVYIALYKPKGVLSASQDDRGRTTVCDLVPLSERLYPVGRLDVTSEGLILLTNDGALTNRLTHPRYEHTKDYHVSVSGTPDDKSLDKWRRGVYLDGKRTAPAKISVLRHEREVTWLRIELREGRKRQIRRVAGMLGHPVQALIRVRIGSLHLGDLKPGEWRHLSPQEVDQLRRMTGVRNQSSRRRPKGRSK
jgi:pseudouridine synthase